MSLQLNKASIRTGVVLIDKQHFKYFDIVSSLMDSLSNQVPAGKLFQDLNDYVIYHLSTEEGLMEKYGYEKMAAHVKQHDFFREKIKEYSALCARVRDIDVNMKMKISNLLIDWFVNHIQTVDRKLCDFILANSKHDSGIVEKLKSLLNIFTAKHGDREDWN
ncbi:MAG: hemerythrin family protein [Victivallaceae bacterium]